MRGRAMCGKACGESGARDNSTSDDEYASIGRRLRREMLLFKRELPVIYVVICFFSFYLCMFPLRRVSHYNHKTLDYYWPPRYSVPVSRATITLNHTRNSTLEHVLLDDYLNRVAPRHGLDLKRITIQKYDYIRGCNGCIDQPLRLDDIGHRAISDWSQTENPLISELCMSFIIVIAIIAGFVPVFQRAPHVYCVSLWVRTCRIGAALHLLRPLFHIVTGLPGTPMHCQSKVVRGGGGTVLHRPHLHPHDDSLGAFLTLLFSMKGGKSCGDLLYSGHMVSCTLLVCTYTHYRTRIFPSRPLLATCLAIVAMAAVGLQAFLILAFRNHYTVDVVGSVLLTVLVYRLDLHFLPEFVSIDSTRTPNARCTTKDKVYMGSDGRTQISKLSLATTVDAMDATAIPVRRFADSVTRCEDESIDDLKRNDCQTSV